METAELLHHIYNPADWILGQQIQRNFKKSSGKPYKATKGPLQVTFNLIVRIPSRPAGWIAARLIPGEMGRSRAKEG